MSTRRTKIAQTLRILLLSPIVSCLALVPMSFKPDIISSPTEVVWSVICLALLPLLSYAVWFALPSLRNKGRDAQRNLAMIFSFVGYAILFVLSLALSFLPKMQVFALTYLLSGGILLVCRVFKLRPSGHCCGVCGPIVYLAVFVSPWYAFALTLVAVVVWASKALQRHTVLQCVAGSLISPLSMIIAALILL